MCRLLVLFLVAMLYQDLHLHSVIIDFCVFH